MRDVIAYKRYFLDFYEKQTDIVQKKIEWTLGFLRDLRYVPEKYFKHVEGTQGIYEIRVHAGNSIYRIFSFFDKENIIVIGNVFIKKTRKTPKNEIKLAERIKEEYFNEKK
jgi:phage-related protein